MFRRETPQAEKACYLTYLVGFFLPRGSGLLQLEQENRGSLEIYWLVWKNG
jgi:hypothetical protein